MSGLELDNGTAALIAVHMRSVAQADGDVHQRELALIKEFESVLPAGAVPSQNLPAQHREAYLRSLAYVALADGKITAPEEAEIRRLAAGLGIGLAEVEGAILDVKREFLAPFQGVKAFREDVEQLAAELGVDPKELWDAQK